MDFQYGNKGKKGGQTLFESIPHLSLIDMVFDFLWIIIRHLQPMFVAPRGVENVLVIPYVPLHLPLSLFFANKKSWILKRLAV